MFLFYEIVRLCLIIFLRDAMFWIDVKILFETHYCEQHFYKEISVNKLLSKLKLFAGRTCFIGKLNY